MSNVRKQTIVISVLIVLIACAGWFAKNFNDSVKDSNALSTKVTQANQTMNFFADSRIQKDNRYSASKQELKEIINNKATTKKAHETATLSLIKLIDRENKENTIETLVKENGFEDALCLMSDKYVEVCVKVSGEMTAEQVHQIKDIIVKNSDYKAGNIVIKPKQ